MLQDGKDPFRIHIIQFQHQPVAGGLVAGIFVKYIRIEHYGTCIIGQVVNDILNGLSLALGSHTGLIRINDGGQVQGIHFTLAGLFPILPEIAKNVLHTGEVKHFQPVIETGVGFDPVLQPVRFTYQGTGQELIDLFFFAGGKLSVFLSIAVEDGFLFPVDPVVVKLAPELRFIPGRYGKGVEPAIGLCFQQGTGKEENG